MPIAKTTVLIILDGWGVADPKKNGNPITPKTAPNYFSWLKKYPNTTLVASGTAVGLPSGQEGNSEAGHLNIGAGRIVKQDVVYISNAIKDGTFFKNSAFLQAINHVKKYKSAAHLMGLLSNHDSAHSCPEHLYALLDLLHNEGIKKVYLHLFTDGRDSGQHDALQHLRKLKAHFHGTERIATVMGRIYGMDRNKIWSRTERAYQAMVAGEGRKVPNAEEALTQAYNSRESDEFISPTIIVERGTPVGTVQANDAIFFFNLRSDRARQLTKVFVQPDFQHQNPDSFAPKKMPQNLRFVALTDFGPDLPRLLTAFPSRDVPNSLVMTLCPRHQLYLSESEKFAHVTYFFNGGYAQHFCDEQWVKIASDNIKDLEFDPEMKASSVTAYLVKAIERQTFDFIAVNYANADMVGHTGNIAAAEKAITVLDRSLDQVVEAALATGSQCVITADHGNVEEMVNAKTGEVNSEHSINPVPFIIISSPTAYKNWGLKKKPSKLRSGGKLADVAPTILKMMGIQKPVEMIGRSLL